MTTKANIIIIEDEKNICSFIEHILEPQGYRVISANTGKEGLQYITSEHPDVILLDLGLPDMDGLKLIYGSTTVGQAVRLHKSRRYTRRRPVPFAMPVPARGFQRHRRPRTKSARRTVPR